MYTLKCRDVGFDCSETMTGNTQEEVLQKAHDHGTKAHNLTEQDINNPEMQNKLKSLITQS